MKIGTRSILFGVHAFWLHPFQIAYAWRTLYGFPWDPRLWVAFFVHDLGYWSKPNMDGPEGESHPELGADIMAIFDDARTGSRVAPGDLTWHQFCLYHSRYYAKANGAQPSRLCFADKLVFVSTPWWLYRILANASGEILEYMREYRPGGKYSAEVGANPVTQKEWWSSATLYSSAWLTEHIDGTYDHWTNRGRETRRDVSDDETR